MEIRKLQKQDEKFEWINDTYAFKDKTGQVIFRCNAVWARYGSFYNKVLKNNGIPLEEIDLVIHPTKGWRWLPIETIDDQQADAYLIQLDKECEIASLSLEVP